METSSELEKNPQKKDYINHLIESIPKTGVLFKDFVISTTLRKSKRMSGMYVKNYNTLIFHIEQFSKENNAIIYTNSVGEFFMDEFISYLESKNLRQNYISGILSLLKSMVSKAGKYGYAVDPSYDDVFVKHENSFSIFLSMNKITRIYYYKGLTKKQEFIRDLFVVGCLTALRFSDFSTLTPDNFTKDYIIKTTKKTKTKVVIPIHEYVREIYNKYEGNLFFGKSIQYFNRSIKSICKRVGFDDELKFSYTKGGKEIYEKRETWQLISSHTARRSAATNMYQTTRMDTYDIMNMTGHATEKSFFHYIKTTKEDKARQIAGDKYFRI